MTKYLLTCECGNNVAVDIGQAGGSVACPCGKQLDVPPLRKLRHLPTAEPAAGTAAPTAWNARKGVIAVFLLVAVVAGVSALIIRWNEAAVPPFDSEVQMFNVERGIENMTPEQGWQLWTARYRPLAEQGFRVFEHGQKAQIEQLAAEQRFTQKLLWTLAAIGSAIALTAALWPKGGPVKKLGAQR